MTYSLRINDFTHPDAKAFWEYAKSLKFVTIEEEDKKKPLPDDQLAEILKEKAVRWSW